MQSELTLETGTQRIEQLVALVVKGEVRIPSFQRGMKWRHQDVRDLFDSIYKGYPIGTLLMWRRRAEEDPNLVIGSVPISAPANDRALWVVDGQQRLTSLVGVLCRKDPDGRGGLFDVWFDPEIGEFFHPTARRSVKNAIPLARVLDATNYQDWLFEFVEKTKRRDLLNLANRLGTAIRDYRVPLYTVDTEDPEVAKDIFVRTNRTGRRLELHEIFAATAVTGSGAARPEEIATRLSARFGLVNPNNVYKAATALRSNSVTHAPRRTTTEDNRKEWMEDTEAALHMAYEFLMPEVLHNRLLPARVTPVVTLARFFHRFPDSSSRNLRLLRRWLWRGFFSGSLESDARTLRRAVTSVTLDEDESVQQLLAGVVHQREELPTRVDSRNSRTRLAFLVLAHAQPVFPDADGGHDTDLFRWLREHGSKTFVRWPGADNVPWARFLVPGGSRKRMKDQMMTWAERSLSIEDLDQEFEHLVELSGHLITSAAAEALIDGDDELFLDLRRKELTRSANDLYLARGEPEVGDRPRLQEVP